MLSMCVLSVLATCAWIERIVRHRWQISFLCTIMALPRDENLRTRLLNEEHNSSRFQAVLCSILTCCIFERGASEPVFPRQAFWITTNIHINEARENVKALSGASTRNPGSPHVDVCDNEIHWVDNPLHSPLLAPSSREDKCRPGIEVYLHGEDDFSPKSKRLRSRKLPGLGSPGSFRRHQDKST